MDKLYSVLIYTISLLIVSVIGTILYFALKDDSKNEINCFIIVIIGLLLGKFVTRKGIK